MRKVISENDLHVQLDRDDKRKLVEIAQATQLSLGGIVRIAIRHWLKDGCPIEVPQQPSDTAH